MSCTVVMHFVSLILITGAPEGVGTMAATYGAGHGGAGGMVKSASYSALSGLEAGAVTSSLAMGNAASPADPAAAAAAPVPLSSLGGRGLQGELQTHHMHSLRAPAAAASAGTGFDSSMHGMYGQQQQQHMGEHMGGMAGSLGSGQHHFGQQQQQHHGFGGSSGMGMPRVQSVPQLSSYRTSDAGSPSLPPPTFGGSRGGMSALQSFSSGPLHPQPYQYQAAQQQPPQQQAGFGAGGHTSGLKLEGTFWNTELSYQVGWGVTGWAVHVRACWTVHQVLTHAFRPMNWAQALVGKQPDLYIHNKQQSMMKHYRHCPGGSTSHSTI